MIDLTKATLEIFAERDKLIAALQVKFAAEQNALITAESEFKAKQDKDLLEFISEQEAKFKSMQETAETGEATIVSEAEAKVGKLAGEYQAELKDAAEADVGAAAEEAEKLSDEVILIQQMTGMTAKEIADDFKKVESVKVAKHLGVKHYGKEIEIAELIVAQLNTEVVTDE